MYTRDIYTHDNNDHVNVHVYCAATYMLYKCIYMYMYLRFILCARARNNSEATAHACALAHRDITTDRDHCRSVGGDGIVHSQLALRDVAKIMFFVGYSSTAAGASRHRLPGYL